MNVVDASVGVLTVPLAGEPPQERLSALQLFADIRAGLMQAHIPDRWADEVGRALWEAVTRRRLHAYEPRPVRPEEAYGWFMDLLAFADTFMHWHYRDWTPEEVWAMATTENACRCARVQECRSPNTCTLTRLHACTFSHFLKRRRQLTNPTVRWIGDYRRQPFTP